MPSTIGVAIPAAGMGRRMGGARKPFLELRGHPILRWALTPFLNHPDVRAIRIAVAEEEVENPPEWLLRLDDRVEVVQGGATRTESVARAIDALPDSVELIAVHDAARPLASYELLERCVEAAKSGVGAVAGRPATDTLKRTKGASVCGTLDRATVWRAQTPQVFPAEMIREAYRRALDGTLPDASPEFASAPTDDASLVERMGGSVVMIESHEPNLKVTHPDDLPLAEFLLDTTHRT